MVASALHLLRLVLSVSVSEETEASSHNHAFLLLSAHRAVVWDAATVTGNQKWGLKTSSEPRRPDGGPVVGYEHPLLPSSCVMFETCV